MIGFLTAIPQPFEVSTSFFRDMEVVKRTPGVRLANHESILALFALKRQCPKLVPLSRIQDFQLETAKPTQQCQGKIQYTSFMKFSPKA